MHIPEPKQPRIGVTATEVAIACGVGEEAIRSATKKHRLDEALLPDGSYDLERATHAFFANRKRPPGPGRPRKPRPPASGGPGADEAVSPWQEQARLAVRHERLKIQERSLKVRRQRERLVDRVPVERMLFERARRLRDGLQAWPHDVAHEIVAVTGGELRPVLDILERGVRRFLERMANEFRHDLRSDSPNRGAA